MTHLQKFFENNTGNCIDKWMHYFDIYDHWFNKYRNKPVVILEIGVYQGGSLNMWRNYFGEDAKIFAIDINPDCKQFESQNTRIFIGSQDDKEFLREVKAQIPKLDILIDDGGHTMNQQIVSFEELYDHVKSDGLYLCEDLHTSYWANYGGGYKRKGSFIEYSKNLIDKLNAWNFRDNELGVDRFTKSTYALHFYTSMLLIEKKSMQPPVSRRTGQFKIPAKDFPVPNLKQNIFKRGLRKLKRKIKG